MEQAHQKNLYLKKIKSMMGIIGSEAAYDLLEDVTIEAIYHIRLRPVKLKSSVYDGRSIPKRELDILNSTLNSLLKDTIIELDKQKNTVTLYDFYTYIETIYLLWRNAISLEFKNAQLFKDSLPIFYNNYTELRESVRKLVEEKVNSIAWLFSDIMRQVLWMEREKDKPQQIQFDNSAYYNNYYIHIQKPETLSIEIDGKKRSIYRVGVSFPFEGITWLTITPDELGINGIMNQFPLKIYIQQHVIERYNERLGLDFKYFEYFSINTALAEKEIYPSDDGSYLFAVKHMSIKVGYLKADIIGDMLLIRTFLFITNNGTPEGKKLSNLIGVQKEDKKYLGIDKLSTFINSDIGENEKLKEIFCNAGCDGLFELKKHLAKNQDQVIHCANYISQFLGLEKEKI
jgi:hypothetical protein